MHCDWLGKEKRYRLYVIRLNSIKCRLLKLYENFYEINLYVASEYELAVNEVQVPVLNREVCNLWITYKELNVTDGMICAGYPDGGKDACQVNLEIL